MEPLLEPVTWTPERAPVEHLLESLPSPYGSLRTTLTPKAENQ